MKTLPIIIAALALREFSSLDVALLRLDSMAAPDPHSLGVVIETVADSSRFPDRV